ncbi:MAG TPA: tRNA (adenosine(37)-N6)-dimethylallyltransferase MiaA [Candidatus Saccharimonadia bacterium]|jgi:tRNA dimethylallyltransferase|nr:tRNA (adenosine(37)-N6)-dimethylallyltransferase MiaA [Candidatus Saccharimonadia bacterium]
MIAIVGTTASGKTDLSLYLAKRFNGEIICADSRTIYRGMDIGTAKPTAEEQAEVPHHLLDVVDPGERLGAAEFKRLAGVAEREILARGRVPFLVGGSGMYVDAVLYDYDFPGASDAGLRAKLEQMGDEALRIRLRETDPEAYESVDLANRRRVIRALETAGQPRSKRSAVRSDVLALGLLLSKEIVQMRIEQRVEKMLSQGFIDEVRRIGEQYGWDSSAFDVIGYRAFKDVILGRKTPAEGAADFVRGDLNLYKKQVTWFKRNREIHWLGEDPQAEAVALVRPFLGV